MKIIGEKWLVKCGRWIGPALVSSLMLGPVACSGGGGSTSESDEQHAASAPARVKYDGETLLRGVLFANGPAASLVDVPANVKIVQGDPRLALGNVLSTLDAQIAQLDANGNHDAARRVEAIRERIASGKLDEKQIREAVEGFDSTILGGDFAANAIAHIRASDPSYLDRFATELYSGDHSRVRDALEDAARRVEKFASSAADDLGGTRGEAKCVAIVVVIVVFIWALFVQAPIDQSGLQHDEAVDRLVSKLSTSTQ